MGELRRIPGIGAVGERDLLELGYTTIQSLAGAQPDPEKLKWWAWKDGGEENSGHPCE